MKRTSETAAFVAFVALVAFAATTAALGAWALRGRGPSGADASEVTADGAARRAELQLVAYAFGHVALAGATPRLAPPLPDYVAGTAGASAREAADGTTLEELEIPPETAASPVELTVGQSSVRVASDDRAMAYAIVRDFQGNRVPDGTPVDLRIALPGGAPTTLATRTDGGLAWHWLPQGLRAGIAPVAALAGPASGAERALFVLPGPPTATTLHIDHEVTADGRRLVTVRSGILNDFAQNAVADGYALTFRASSIAGVREARVPAVNGRVSWRLRAPTVAETIHVALYAGAERIAEAACVFASGLRAAPLVVFEVGPPPVSRSADDTGVELPSRFAFSEGGAAANASRVDDETRDETRSDTRDVPPPRLRAGPFLGTLGQLVPDGTEAFARVTDAEGGTAVLAAVIDRGEAVWTLPATMTASLPLRVQFRVGGAKPTEDEGWTCTDGRCGAAVVDR